MLARAVILAAAVAISPRVAPASEPPRPPVNLSHHHAEQAAQRAAWAQAKVHDSWAPPQTALVVDVHHYHLDLEIDPARQRLSGAATVTVEALEPTSRIELDLDLGVRVLSVERLRVAGWPGDSPVELDFLHADDRLAVELPAPAGAGQVMDLRVVYGGRASRGGYGVSWTAQPDGTRLVSTFAEPFGARVWFPCQDRPDDKATFSFAITAPEWMDVAANGLQVGRQVHPDGTATTSWRTDYPTSTYLAVMNASDFELTVDTYTAGDGSTMPIQTWAYPFLSDLAAADLAVTAEMIETMASRFGEYPFVAEKYGNVTTNFGGGMEHQTLTTISAGAIGSGWIDWLNVHELGHQWWGDMVGPDDWRELWLNEGFATYSEILWAEHLGPSALASALADNDWRGYFLGPLFDNPVPFSGTVYSKGALVLHMLRWELGDAAFFDALAHYRQEHELQTATSESLRAAVEAVHGADLEWFWEQWVYGVNRPRLQYDWHWTGSAVELMVEQEQTNAPVFRLSLPVRLSGPGGSEDLVVVVDSAHTEAELPSSIGEPTAVVVDPDRWLLAEVSRKGEPDLELGPDFPDGYDAGVTLMGQTRELLIPLTNTGGSPLQVVNAGLYQGAGFSVRGPQLPVVIQPGSTVDLVVDYRPTGPGADAGVLWVQSDDPSRGGNSLIPVSGIGALVDGPRLATQSGITFPPTGVGTVSERELQLTNLGSETLTLAPRLTDGPFAMASSVPSTIPPGSSVDVFVRYLPTTAGEHTATLALDSNDPLRPVTELTLRGSAEPAARLEVTPRVLRYGLAAAGSQRTLQVCNRGGGVLQVTGLVLPSGLTRVANAGPQLPFELTPDSCEELVLELGDLSGAGYLGDIRLRSGDPNLATARIAAHVASQDPVGTELAFAAAAATPGAAGSLWSTRATVLNPSSDDVVVDLTWHSAEPRPVPGPDLSLTVPAGAQRTLPDLVRTMSMAGSGGVTLAATGPLVAVSRTFTSGPAGSYGQMIPAEMRATAIGTDEVVSLPGVRDDGSFRTNLGLLSVSDSPVSVTIGPADGAAALVLDLPPRGYRQVNRILPALGVEDDGAVTLRVTSDSDDAAYHVWASIIDELSNDPTWVAPQRPSGTLDELIVPVVTTTDGLFGTRWTTTLVLHNAGATALDVRGDLWNPGDQSDHFFVEVTDLAAGDTLRFDDVVAALTGAAGTGWMSWTPSEPGLVARARIATESEDGSYGQLVPVGGTPAIATAADPVVVPGLRSDPGFRTNLGLTSLAQVETRTTLEFFDDRGGRIGRLEVELPARGFVQLVRVLGSRLDFVGSAWVRVGSMDPDAAVLVHASVIDDHSGDPIYVPGVTEPGAPVH